MIYIVKLKEFFLKYYAFLTAFVVLIFYALTLAPGVIASDSGELATVQYTLGIAHPTGYPLFTILGFLFSHIPIPVRPIVKLNFLTALWSALTVYFLIITLKLVLDKINFFVSSFADKKKELLERFKLSEECKIFSSVFGGLAIGFSKTFWFQSLSVEVYTLHIFLNSVVIYFSLKAFIDELSNGEKKVFQDKWFLAFVFLALAFTNHLSTIFTIPSFLFLYFYRWNFSSQKVKRFLIYGLISLIILIAIYLYLPIRAMMQPYLNWGNPVTLQSFINHISGKLYHQFLFPTFGEYISKVGYFLNTFSLGFDKNEFAGSDFSIVTIIAFLGIIVAAFLFTRIFYFFIFIILSTLLISSIYNIPDIDGYYLLAHYGFAFFAGIGLFYLFTINFNRRLKLGLISFIFVLAIFLEINFNYSRVDLSDNTLMDDYTIRLLDSVDENSIVISARSSFYFPTLYYQIVEGYRKDVVVVEHLLVQQKWYYTQLNKIHPGVITLQDTVVSLNLSNRSVYFSAEMLEKSLKGEVKLPDNLELVPDKFLFKLVPKNTYYEIDVPDYNFKFNKHNLYETGEIKNLISNMLMNRAIYEILRGKIERSKKFLMKLKKDFPDYVLPSDLEKLIIEKD